MEKDGHHWRDHPNGRPNMFHPLLDSGTYRWMEFRLFYRSVLPFHSPRGGLLLLGITDTAQIGSPPELCVEDLQYDHLLPRHFVPIQFLGNQSASIFHLLPRGPSLETQ